MPHCTLEYYANLDVDAVAILKDVEDIVLRHDPDARVSKGRAYPAPAFLHTNMRVTVDLLAKPHRDPAFMAALQADLVEAISSRLPRPCWLSVDLVRSGAAYFTKELT